MNSRRVVITGIGLITPLGLTTEETWSSLIIGKSGISKISKFDPSRLNVQIAGEVKGLRVETALPPKEIKKMGLFTQFAVIAAKQALKNAGLSGRFGEEGEALPIDPTRVGVNVSAGMGGLPEIQEWDRELALKEKKVVTPFFVPAIIPNLAAGQVSISCNAKGPNLCVVTACASSAHSVVEATRSIQRGETDVMIAGGAEAVICELGIVAFSSMKALSTQNELPEKASRPFHPDRDGFVMSEGAAILILEELSHAKKRGARIYCEMAGYGATSDAYHMTTPSPDGSGAIRAMTTALNDAKLDPSHVGYVNAHGTSTPAGDLAEATAIAKVWQEGKKDLHVSSTKSMTGHLLGAAGSLETAICALSLLNGVIPPTINLDLIDSACEETGLCFTPLNAVKKDLQAALTNSFGFGGTNASLVLKKI